MGVLAQLHNDRAQIARNGLPLETVPRGTSTQQDACPAGVTLHKANVRIGNYTSHRAWPVRVGSFADAEGVVYVLQPFEHVKNMEFEQFFGCPFGEGFTTECFVLHRPHNKKKSMQ